MTLAELKDESKLFKVGPTLPMHSYFVGLTAWLGNQSIDHNPFPSGGNDYHDWRYGWASGKIHDKARARESHPQSTQ